jgi:immune inhibitor A
MAAGSWGCGVSDRDDWVRPTHFGPWEKERLGWLSNVQVVGPGLDQDLILEPVQTSEQVLKVPLEPNANPSEGEYLLMEYRTKEGFDADLPASGVLVYHIDPKIGGNRPCDTCPQVYRVSLLEADGNNTLTLNFLQGGNRGEAGDAWGAFGPGRLTPGTYPSTRLHSGAASPVTVYEISLGEGSAHINLSSSAVPISSLLQSFLGTASPPLTSQEAHYLDSKGNENGLFDVGDLRAYLKR